MPDGTGIAVVVLLALPGFLALGVFSTLAPCRDRDFSVTTVLVVGLAILSYLATHGLSLLFCWVPSPSVLLSASTADLHTVFNTQSLRCVLVASGVGVFCGVILTFSSHHEIFHRLCRTIGISRRFGYSSHWDAVLHTTGRKAWISVKFEDGDEYVGWLSSNSDASEERSLSLCRVAKYGENEKMIEWAEDELLFLPDLSRVRSVRLRPIRKERVNHGKQQWWKRWRSPV